MSRDWLLYLDDLIAAAEKIGRLVDDRTFETFGADEAVFDAVLMNLLVIGEAVKNLPAEARAAAPEIDWSAIAGMRDIIAHRYFGLDPQIVWDAATTHVPGVLSAARRILVQAEPINDGEGEPR